MEHKYLKLPAKNVRFAPMMQAGRHIMDGRCFRSGGGKGSKGGGDDDDDDDSDDDAEEKEALLKEIEKRTKKLVAAAKLKPEEIRAMLDEQFGGITVEALRGLMDDKTGALARVTEQGVIITELRAQVKTLVDNAPKETRKSVKDQVEAWMKDTEVVAQLRNIKNGINGGLKPMEIRAVASPMTTATVANSSNYLPMPEIEKGINDLVRSQPIFWDYIPKGRSSSSRYVWINKSNPQGAAGWLAPGQAKPGISVSTTTNISEAKKIAAKEKMSVELLEDVEGVTDFLLNELYYQVMIAANTAAMTGSVAGDANSINGIQTLSVPYSLTTVKTTNPNYMDAIRAGVAQLRSGWLGKFGGDITVFVNSIDAANMDLAKATDSGVYLLPPFVTADGTTIAGARVVEDNNVEIGNVQFAFLRLYKILIYKDYYVSWGWENDDFTKNLVTVLGEMRVHQIFNDQYAGAFIYDSFADMITAITA